MDLPNVVWITLDSVRADHTTMGGYERDTTPVLQHLANDDEGTYFKQCISHGRYTMVSTASILTGTYPSYHQAGYTDQAIPSALPTIAERFKNQSYYTALLSDNAFVSDATGLDRGFDRSTCIIPSTLLDLPSTLLKTVGPFTLAKYLFGLNHHSVGFTTDMRKHSRTYLVNAVAKNWLSSLENREPFFLYIHNDEPHRPYCPPLPYRDTFTDDIALAPSEAADFSMYVHENLMEIVANGCELGNEEWDALRAMYDAEIRYSDEKIKDLVEFIRRGSFGETIFVITADHGEYFGEHGLLGHKYRLDDAVLNVPLITHGLDVHDKGSPIQHTDVMATLLERVNADTDGIQGIDLRYNQREYAIAQDHALSTDELLKYNPDLDITHYPTDERSVLHDGKYKLHLDEKGETLYQLPDEATDVSSQFPHVAKNLKRELTDWLETEGQPFSKEAESAFSSEMRQHLADLGYVDDELPD